MTSHPICEAYLGFLSGTSEGEWSERTFGVSFPRLVWQKQPSASPATARGSGFCWWHRLRGAACPVICLVACLKRQAGSPVAGACHPLFVWSRTHVLAAVETLRMLVSSGVSTHGGCGVRRHLFVPEAKLRWLKLQVPGAEAVARASLRRASSARRRRRDGARRSFVAGCTRDAGGHLLFCHWVDACDPWHLHSSQLSSERNRILKSRGNG